LPGGGKPMPSVPLILLVPADLVAHVDPAVAVVLPAPDSRRYGSEILPFHGFHPLVGINYTNLGRSDEYRNCKQM
jgi:hypothetical protein